MRANARVTLRGAFAVIGLATAGTTALTGVSLSALALTVYLLFVIAAITKAF